jgi:uncharacterized protein YbcI
MKMTEIESNVAQQLARAARRFQEQRTGHAPTEVTVVLGDDTLVITLQDALTRAESVLSKSPAGAAQVQEFHRQLFANSSAELRREITRITGRHVREAVTEIESANGSIVHAFTTGAMVQVFLLASGALPSTDSVDDMTDRDELHVLPEEGLQNDSTPST